MLHISSRIHRFPFEYPFKTSHGVKSEQDVLEVSLGMAHWKGYGECTSIPYYFVDVNVLKQELEKYQHHIVRYAYNGPERFWHFLHHQFSGQNFLISALDIASWDLFSKMKNVPLYKIIGLQWKYLKPTCYTIGIHNIDALEAIIQEHPNPIYKLKVSQIDDVAYVAKVRSLSNSEIWVDANAAWNLNEAKHVMNELHKLGVTVVEQPFAVGEDEGIRELKSWNNDMIYIADESCKNLDDLNKILPFYDGVNIKLSKCGGITPALQMLQTLKREKKKVMLGSMCDSQAGANALTHLIPLADYVDIDGPLLLNHNNPTLHYINGMIELVSQEGVGYTPYHL
jgi:L-alanine-DL-glutamate epimerase-like enolase superfamily enzyme